MPAFIAVEAKEEVYRKLKHQRKKLRQLLINRTNDISTQVIDLLASTVYYEADTHARIFPSVPTVWLDANRKSIQQKELRDFAENRFNFYQKHLTNKKPISAISEQAWAVIDLREPPLNPLGEPDFDRDFLFQEAIMDAITTYQGEWALTVVGAKHAVSRKNSMKVLVENEGVSCTVSILRPEA